MIVPLLLADLAFGSGSPALAVGAGEVVLSKIDSLVKTRFEEVPAT